MLLILFVFGIRGIMSIRVCSEAEVEALELETKA